MTGWGVIFDMDGVLVDSYHAHFEAWRQAAAECGMDLIEAQFASVFGQTNRDILQGLWPGRFADADIPAWGDRKEIFYRRIIEADFPEMDGAGDLLAALHRAGAVLAIGSSGPPENVAVVRKCLPNARLFSADVTGAEVTRGKPEPEVFLKAAAKLHLPPSRCAVVEDAPVGVEAGRRAGMAVVALTGTALREKLAERAHLVVDSLRDVTPKIIAGLIDANGD